jgi:hypothetical protein
MLALLVHAQMWTAVLDSLPGTSSVDSVDVYASISVLRFASSMSR